MKKNKKRVKQQKQKKKYQQKLVDNPIAQKFSLILFGLGPIAIIGWFLFSRGFFEPIN